MQNCDSILIESAYGDPYRGVKALHDNNQGNLNGTGHRGQAARNGGRADPGMRS
jgi:hypothetical protein